MVCEHEHINIALLPINEAGYATVRGWMKLSLLPRSKRTFASKSSIPSVAADMAKEVS